MAEPPSTRKRAVAAKKTIATSAGAAKRTRTATAVVATVATAARPVKTSSRKAMVLEEDAPATNYALRLTEDEDEDVWVAPVRPRRTPTAAPTPVDTFEARMSEALRAISAAQGASEAPPQRMPFLKALDKMPPVRLGFGPAIPWRIALPALVALVAVMFFVSRPDTSRADAQPAKLPAQETYAVQDAPLFAHPAEAAPTPDAPAKPIGVPEPAGASIDFLDLGFKLVAVLALAYGSLVLLKRAGLGGNAANGSGAGLQGMRVVSSLALAPNRSVHVIRVPGGRTLLVGATPSAVNLLADLGMLAEDETPEASSFLGALKGKLV